MRCGSVWRIRTRAPGARLSTCGGGLAHTLFPAPPGTERLVSPVEGAVVGLSRVGILAAGSWPGLWQEASGRQVTGHGRTKYQDEEPAAEAAEQARGRAARGPLPRDVAGRQRFQTAGRQAGSG